MSSRKELPVTLSPRARQDFVDILQYTGETWGEAQLLIYRDKIDEALQAIGRNPNIGHRATTCRRRTWPIWSARTSSCFANVRAVSASCASCTGA